MPASFPTLSQAHCTLYPCDRAISAPVHVAKFLNGSEQRWRTAPVLNEWMLLIRATSADVTAIQNFWDTVKGAYDSTWTLTFDGETFTNCVFEADDLVIERPGASASWKVQLKVRQCVQSMVAPSAPTAYPTINGGVVTQYPYSATRKWATTRNRMPNGKQWAWAEWTAPRRTWQLNYPNITPAEASDLLDCFVGAGGQWGSFSFTDVGGAAYATCRFGMDSFNLRYLGKSECSVSGVVIEELV